MATPIVTTPSMMKSLMRLAYAQVTEIQVSLPLPSVHAMLIVQGGKSSSCNQSCKGHCEDVSCLLSTAGPCLAAAMRNDILTIAAVG